MKDIRFLGTSLADLRAFPKEARQEAVPLLWSEEERDE
jgi:phage-related protein